MTHARAQCFGVVLGFLAGAPLPSTRAQEPAGGSRRLCDPGDPRHDCPGRRCLCTDDALEIVFPETGTNRLELVAPESGRRLDATVVLDTRSDGVTGWSYGVDHDEASLTILEATGEGTDAEPALAGGFFVIHFTDILTCVEPTEAGCARWEPGTGLISAGSLSFTLPLSFPIRPNTLARLQYALEAPTGTIGARIALVEHLRLNVGLQSLILLTIQGATRQPSLVTDGFVTAIAAGSARFRRGDYDASGAVELTDALGLLGYLFLGNNAPGCLDAGDADDNGILRVNDVVLMLAYLFLGTGIPSAPGPSTCGPDPRDEQPDLGCERGCE